MNNSMPKMMLNIERLKKFAFEKLPKDWPLRWILLAEKDEIDASTFLARLPLYLKLSTLKGVDSK